MSKKILKGVLGGVAFAALTVATGGAAGVLGAVAGFTSATLGVGTLAGTLIAGGVLGGVLAGVSSLLGPKGFSQQDLAKNTQITSSPAASRQLAYGQTATAGHLIFRDSTGKDNEILHMVLVLAGSEIDSLVGMTVNGKTITLPAMPGGEVVSGNFSGKLQVYFHDGSDTTAPFSGSSISGLFRWTAKTRKLRGLPAVYVKATIDEEFEGKFEPMFEIKGRKVYDPRLDTTKGGSGTHRFDDPSTWEWSNNPVLQMLDYTRGIKVNSKLIGGLNRPESEFDFDSIMAEANICEESVALKAGGTENRYEGNGFVDLGRPHRDNLNAISSAMAGRWTYAAGKWRFLAGAYRTPTITLSGADINGTPGRYRRHMAQADRINTVRGTFRDATQNHEVHAYPTVVNSAAVTADGETLATDLNLPMTTSHTMAQRIAKIALNRARAAKQLSAQFNHRAINALPGETLTFSYPNFNLSAQTMLVDKWDLAPVEDKNGNVGLAVNMDLIEEDSSWYDWDESTEEQSMTGSVVLSGLSNLMTTFGVGLSQITDRTVGDFPDVSISSGSGQDDIGEVLDTSVGADSAVQVTVNITATTTNGHTFQMYLLRRKNGTTSAPYADTGEVVLANVTTSTFIDVTGDVSALFFVGEEIRIDEDAAKVRTISHIQHPVFAGSYPAFTFDYTKTRLYLNSAVTATAGDMIERGSDNGYQLIQARSPFISEPNYSGSRSISQSVVFEDSPGAGDWDYKVRIGRTNNQAAATISNINIKIEEIKR